MEIWYQIKATNGWITVDYDAYAGFDGEKRIWGPTHGIVMVQKYLQSLRWR